MGSGIRDGSAGQAYHDAGGDTRYFDGKVEAGKTSFSLICRLTQPTEADVPVSRLSG